MVADTDLGQMISFCLFSVFWNSMDIMITSMTMSMFAEFTEITFFMNLMSFHSPVYRVEGH